MYTKIICKRPVLLIFVFAGEQAAPSQEITNEKCRMKVADYMSEDRVIINVFIHVHSAVRLFRFNIFRDRISVQSVVVMFLRLKV